MIRIEQWSGTLFEPTLQRLVDSSELLIKATTYTYWLSQFVVVGLTLLWVYFRHHERFAGFRNWLIVANLLGLICYVLVPTAPPRMFPEWGFVDTLAQYSGVNHESRDHRPYGQPVRGDAEPPLDGCVHRRRRHVRRLPQPDRARVLWLLVAGLGLVLGHGNRQPLLARRRRGRRRSPWLTGVVLFRRTLFSRWRPTVAS